MNTLLAASRSTIGRKLVMAVTGLLLFGFLVVHMAGNLFLFKGPESFNSYAHMLETNPALPVAEICLAALFLIHIASAISLTLDNWKARPEGYRYSRMFEKDAYCSGYRTVGSYSMVLTGILTLLFVAVHLYDFRLTKDNIDSIKQEAGVAREAERAQATVAGGHGAAEEAQEDLFYWVEYRFAKQPRALLRVIFYLLCLTGLGLHLSHGIQSVARTIGLSHPGYCSLVKKAGYLLTAVVVLGFASMPLFFYLRSHS